MTEYESTFEISGTLAARGIYDEDKQLNNEQVVAFKALMQDKLIGEILQREVVVKLVEDAIAEMPSDDHVELLKNPKVVQLMAQAAFLAVNYQQVLIHAINEPDAQWPEGYTPPATFVDALRSDEATETILQIKAINDLDFSQTDELYSVVTGKNIESTTEEDL